MVIGSDKRAVRLDIMGKWWGGGSGISYRNVTES